MTRNIYSCKLSVAPSGRCSLLYGPVAPPPCQSRQSSPELQGVISDGRYDVDSNGEVQAKPGKGGLGHKSELSWKSGRNVKEVMAAQEREFGKEKSWFLTITLPSVDERSYEALARFSSYAIDRLNKGLKRFFKGEEFCRSNVWEYQKRGALHAHFLICSRSIKGYKIASFRRHIAEYWYRILKDIGRKFGADMFLGRNGESRSLEALLSINKGKHFVNCQQVRKSVVAYLSSYLGDSSKEKDRKGKQHLRKRYFPIATWAQWDRKCTRLRAKYTFEFSFGEAKNVDSVSIESAFVSLENTLPCVEGTEIKRPKKPFIKGLYFIASMQCRKDVCKLVEAVREELQWIFDDSMKYQDWLKNNRQKQHDYDTERLAVDMHDARFLYWEHCESKRREAEELGANIAKSMRKLFVNMLNCELQVVGHKRFSPELKNHRQLRLI